MEFFLCVLGMVMIFEGLPYFGFPSKMKLMMKRLLETRDSELRIFGLLLMIMGLILIYIGRR